MSLDRPQRFPRVSRIGHGLLMLAIVSNLTEGWLIGPAASARSWGPWITLHGWSGLLVALALPLLLSARLQGKRPGKAGGGRGLQFVVWLVHSALYVTCAGLVVSGIALALASGAPLGVLGLAAETTVVTAPATFGLIIALIHEALALSVIALVGAHVSGAVWHHWIWRDRLIDRIWPL